LTKPGKLVRFEVEEVSALCLLRGVVMAEEAQDSLDGLEGDICAARIRADIFEEKLSEEELGSLVFRIKEGERRETAVSWQEHQEQHNKGAVTLKPPHDQT